MDIAAIDSSGVDYVRQNTHPGPLCASATPGTFTLTPGGTLKVTYHLAYGVSYAVEGYKQGARAWIKSIAATGLQP